VRAGLGVGAAATLAVSVWQAIDSTRTSYAHQASDERSALKELTDLWAKIPPQSGTPETDAARVGALGELAAAIVRTADTLCPVHEAGWFQRSPVAVSVYDTALHECGQLTRANRPISCTVLLEAAHPSLQSAYPNCLVRSEGSSAAKPTPRYWVFDYSDNALVANAHPCDSIAAGRREAQREYREGTLDLTAQANTTEVSRQTEIDAGCTVSTEAVSSNPAANSSSGAAGVCQGKSIYIQIYDPDQIRLADHYRSQWKGLGALTPPAENVNDTARLAGRATPLIVAATTVRYHDIASAPCAHALSNSETGTQWKVEALAPRFPATPGVIEVWLKPR
jgi:hypothetical protein